jgi:hypothetical protein
MRLLEAGSMELGCESWSNYGGRKQLLLLALVVNTDTHGSLFHSSTPNSPNSEINLRLCLRQKNSKIFMIADEIRGPGAGVSQSSGIK